MTIIAKKASKVSYEVDAQIRADVEALRPRCENRKMLSKEVAGLLFFRYRIYATANLVLNYSERGSITDVSKDVAEFWEDVRETAKVRIHGADIPEPFLSVVGELASNMWLAACANSESAFDVQRTELSQEMTQLKQQAEAAAGLAAQSAVAAASLELEVTRLKSILEQTQVQLSAETHEKSTILIRAKGLEVQLASEVKARQAAQEQFSNDLALEREARSESEGFLKNEMHYALQQVDDARQQTKLVQEQLRLSENDKAVLEVRLGKDMAELRDQNMVLQNASGELRGALNATRQALEQVTRQFENSSSQTVEIPPSTRSPLKTTRLLRPNPLPRKRKI